METGPRENNHKGRKSPEKEDLPTVFQLLVIESSKEEYMLMVPRFKLCSFPFCFFYKVVFFSVIYVHDLNYLNSFDKNPHSPGQSLSTSG